MTEPRHTADTITDDALDQLHRELDQQRTENRTLRDALIHCTHRDERDRAEAAIARVRAVCDDLDALAREIAHEPAAVHPVAAKIRHHLNEPTEA